MINIRFCTATDILYVNKLPRAGELVCRVVDERSIPGASSMARTSRLNVRCISKRQGGESSKACRNRCIRHAAGPTGQFRDLRKVIPLQVASLVNVIRAVPQTGRGAGRRANYACKRVMNVSIKF